MGLKIKLGLPRSSLIAMDLYTTDRCEAGNTKKNIAHLQHHHAESLNSRGDLREFHIDENTRELTQYKPTHITWVGIHICDSYKNPAVYCVYDEKADPLMDHCLHCRQPYERK